MATAKKTSKSKKSAIDEYRNKQIAIAIANTKKLKIPKIPKLSDRVIALNGVLSKFDCRESIVRELTEVILGKKIPKNNTKGIRAYEYIKGCCVVPLNNPVHHDYDIGKMVYCTRVTKSEVSGIKPGGLKGNNLVEHSTRSQVRQATDKEIISFFKTLPDKVLLTLEDTK